MDGNAYNTMNIEKDCGALGGMFQQIINDMKTSSPIWEDFLNKATKLHAALRTTVVATTAFLDAFQKVADLATNTKGATKEIGSSLTRLCIRHRSIEKKLKEFTNAILEVMVLPLQDKKEDWKSRVMHLDKEHAKEYKKARAEIKRATTDTMKLQKKLKKGKSDLQGHLNTALQDVTDKFLLLEETEKNSVRQALIEQRGQFCQFIYAMKPVVDGEITMITEVTHLQEILDSLSQQSAEPATLPPASEQVIQDLKGEQSSYTYQTPPSSPSSLGSRKSSMCSINSLNSNSSGSTHNNSPSHHIRHRPASQHNGILKRDKSKSKLPIPPGAALRLSSISSQDSGFTSQDALFLRPPSPSLLDFRRKSSAHGSGGADGASSSSGTGTDSGGTTPSPCHPLPPSASLSTWSNWPDPPYAIRQDGPGAPPSTERPHTISTAYEKSHTRPPLSKDMFDPPEGALKPQNATAPPTPNPYALPCVTPDLRDGPGKGGRPTSLPAPPLLGPKPRAKAVAAPVIPEGSAVRRVESLRKSGSPHVYVNTRELATIPGGNEDAAGADSTDKSAPPDDGQTESEQNFAELSEAMLHLNSCTAALEESLATEDGEDGGTPPGDASHRLSMPSSGYGTLPGTPACSEGALSAEVDSSSSNPESPDPHNTTLTPSTADCELPPPPDPCDLDLPRFSTLPRMRGGTQSFRLPPSQRRPVSMTGPPVSAQTSTATIRRSSVHASMRGPPPPLRRNSSITGGAVPVVPPNVPKLPGHDGINHRRSHSESKPRSLSASSDQSRGSTASDQSRRGKSSDRSQHPRSATFTMSDDDDDDTDSIDDLPLPPPPMELSQTDSYKIRRQSSNITTSHADVMNTLNQKLGPKRPQSSPALIRAHPQGDQPIYAVPQLPTSGQPQQQPIYTLPTTQGHVQPIYATPYAHPQQPKQQQPQQHYTQLPQQPHYTHLPPQQTQQNIYAKAPPYTQPPAYMPPSTHNAVHGGGPPANPAQAYSAQDSTEDVTPTGDAPPESFLQQIKSGVRLRKAHSNDRSKPKLK